MRNSDQIRISFVSWRVRASSFDKRIFVPLLAKGVSSSSDKLWLDDMVFSMGFDFFLSFFFLSLFLSFPYSLLTPLFFHFSVVLSSFFTAYNLSIRTLGFVLFIHTELTTHTYSPEMKTVQSDTLLINLIIRLAVYMEQWVKYRGNRDDRMKDVSCCIIWMRHLTWMSRSKVAIRSAATLSRSSRWSLISYPCVFSFCLLGSWALWAQLV